ncbi:MAG: AAA family ATPase [Armatimonadota bacterium]
MTAQTIAEKARTITATVSNVILGKEDVVEKAVLTLLCNGHLLLEDVPGVGKTMLSKALARAIGGEFRRVQFTPDLLPSDITGSSVFNQKTSEFEFRPGPIFGNVVLADEINRATPKTQSALLEAMEERTVTSDGVTHPLPDPFFVLATQNNVELTGTYPLPEAQLDRFFAKLSIGYPDRDVEANILKEQQVHHPIEDVQPVVTKDELLEMQVGVREVFVHAVVREYIVDIVRMTSESNQILLGASPRGSLLLMHAAQAHAVLHGSEFVRPDDVKTMAPSILAHRIVPRPDLKSRGVAPEELIQDICAAVPAPVPVGG